MAYRHGNYDFVIDSSFTPFTMQEMLVPFTAYKEAAERDEAAYVELQDKADKFKYLSETLPKGSKARDIYESYANQLQADAQDFVNNGVSMSNRRNLTNLKRNYSSTIGRLAEADVALKKEQELRRQLSAKDPSMLYAINGNDLNIDKFLDNQTPNLYSVSGTDLYTKGAAAGQAASKRIYFAGDQGSTLGGYYRDYVQKMGYTPEDLMRFGNQISADFAAQVSVLPELQQAANQILEANGVNANLSGETLRQAQQQVIRGIIDGSVYTESHNPTRDPGIPSWSEKRADERAEEEMLFNRSINGYEKINGRWIYNPQKDQKVAQTAAIAAAKNNGKSGSSRGSSSEYGAINQQVTRVSWKGNNPNDLNGDADDDVDVVPLDKDESYVGVPYDYDDLPQYAKNKVDKIIGKKGNYDNYIYYFKPFEKGLFNDKEASLDIVPRKIQKDNVEEDDSDFDFSAQ